MQTNSRRCEGRFRVGVIDTSAWICSVHASKICCGFNGTDILKSAEVFRLTLQHFLHLFAPDYADVIIIVGFGSNAGAQNGS